MFFAFALYSQNPEPARLPDLERIDTMRIQKGKVRPTDTLVSLRFITVDVQGDSVRGKWQDSAAVVESMLFTVWEEQNKLSAITNELWKSLRKTRGVDIYSRQIRRTTNRTYTEITFDRFGKNFLGTWRISINGQVHTATVEANRDVRRTNAQALPVNQRFVGKFGIMCETRIMLERYTGAENITLDKIQGTEIFQSPDGRVLAQKIN